nr:hypothetical protein L203_01125 [Cryptococcus depauperatus CBS 7841]
MPLSRIQLAAALVDLAHLAVTEYDNDDDDFDNPQKPRKNWQDSAIFIPFQQAEKEERRQRILSQPPPVLPNLVEATHPSIERSQTPDVEQQALEEEELDIADAKKWELSSRFNTEEADIPVRRRVASQPLPLNVINPSHHRARSVYLDSIEDTRSEDDGQNSRTRPSRRVSLSQYGMIEASMRSERIEQLAHRPHTAMGLQDGMRPEHRDRRISNPRMIPLPGSPSSMNGTRSLSSLSRNMALPSTTDTEEMLEDLGPNPFALPAPPPQMGSRFDPKILEEQRRSSFETAPRLSSSRSGSRMSLMLDVQTSRHSTDMSKIKDQIPSPPIQPSLRVGEEYSEIPTPKRFGRPLMPQRYSTSALTLMNRRSLRPNTLIMPSPLTGIERSAIEIPVPEGFIRGDKPLPPNARTQGKRLGIPLSLSQRTFRGSLVVDGRRDDKEWLGGVEIDGEVGMSINELDEGVIERRPGKLYGRSLIDELEARKSIIKGKQRVFTGDSRPAMMSRSSVSFDPSLSLPLPASPVSPDQTDAPRPSTFHPAYSQPLLEVDSSGGPVRHSAFDLGNRSAKSRSIFGVDHVWEREMTKLKLIQEEEKTRLRQNELQKRDKRKSRFRASVFGLADKKYKNDEISLKVEVPELEKSPEMEQTPRASPTQPGLINLEFDSDFVDDRLQGFQQTEIESDLSLQPRDNTSSSVLDDDFDSDEDAPLSRMACSKTLASTFSDKPPQLSMPSTSSTNDNESDSDEDVPLSKMTRSHSAHNNTSQVGSTSSDHLGLRLSPPIDGEDYGGDEDDLPLVVRRAKVKGIAPPTRAEIIEDELPLGYKHAEAAQRQMAKRITSGAGSTLDDGRGSMMSFAPGMNTNAAMSMGMVPGMVPGMWAMPGGHPMTMGLPYGQMAFGMPSMSMPNLGIGVSSFGSGLSPAANIDSWRHEVPTAAGSGRSGKEGVV